MKQYKKSYNGQTYEIQDFDSMIEVYNYIKDTKNINSYRLAQDGLLTSESYFYGVDKFEKVMAHLQYGDSDMTFRYLDKLNDIKNEEGMSETSFHMDVQGVAYDMGAVVSGEPECCLSQNYPETKPYLKIFIDTGYCGGTDVDIIANRGLAIYELINNLLARGYILDIYIIHYITVSHGSRLRAQRIKLGTSCLDMSALAYMGTCEFFRVVTWLLTAIQIQDVHYTGDGCSKPGSGVIAELKKEGLYIPSGYTEDFFNRCSFQEASDKLTEIYNNYVKENACK